MEISHVFGYLGAILIGIILGLSGGGGALIATPVLVYLFHIEPFVATGYSLFLVAISASIGAVQNIRKQTVDYNAALFYGIPSVITVYLIRRFVIPNLPSTIISTQYFSVSKNHLLLFILAVVMFGAAYKMITDDSQPVADEKREPNRLMLVLYAVLIGSFLGLVGAGGGFLIVPVLVYLGNVPLKKAVGTSLVLVSINSIIGFTGDLHSNTNMDWKFLFTFAAFSVGGVLIGTYLSNFVEPQKLRKYFGWFILIVAIYIVAREAF